MEKGGMLEDSPGNNITYHALELIQGSLRMQQANCIPRNEAPERVSDDAEFLDLAALFLDGLKFLLDLQTESLAAKFDAVVGERSRVALGAEYV